MQRFGQVLGLRPEHAADYEADMAKIAADPTTQEWWALCGPMQRPVAEGEWWHTIEEVFHVD